MVIVGYALYLRAVIAVWRGGPTLGSQGAAFDLDSW